MKSCEELIKIHDVSNTQQLMNKLSVKYQSNKYRVGDKEFDDFNKAITYANDIYDPDMPQALTQKQTLPSDLSNKGFISNTRYSTAISVSQFISTIGIIVAAIGLILSAILLLGVIQSPLRSIVASIMALMPGVAIALAGLFLTATGQLTRATADNADQTREILKILKENR
jgi:hypothetical protein